jgi:predicted thioesterase
LIIIEIIIGKTATAETTVIDDNTALVVGSGALPVFATPMFLALMEKAACNALSGSLDEGLTSVGIAANIQHTAASSIGAKITATAEIIGANGRTIDFKIIARDEAGEIGEGTHTRVIVDAKRFIAKANARKEK